MKNRQVTSGYSKNGLPYFRIEGGSQTVVIFEGLSFNHRPPSGLTLWVMSNGYKRFTEHFTIYYVNRKPGLPAGYSIQDMSEDYATMVRNEIKAPIDLMGISTGGPIAQCFAVDHPELVHKLVLAMTGYRLSDRGAKLQRRIIETTRQKKWRAAAAAMADGMTSGLLNLAFKILFWMFGKSIFGALSGSGDGLVELEAEDKFNFKERLADIKVPTLVIGGENDSFYPIRETADGIPNAKLILYKKVGHTAMFKSQFNRDVFNFLSQDKTEVK
jgi:pimeloyl-ACP methyl ester carboxylesterase